MLLATLHCANCVVGEGIMLWGYFSGVGLVPLVIVMGNLNASVYQDNLGNSMPPTLWEQFGEGVQTKVYKDMDG